MPQNRELIPTEERIYLKEKKAQELIEHENIVKAIKIPQELLEVVREKYGNLPKIFALGMEYANKGTVSSVSSFLEVFYQSYIDKIWSAVQISSFI